MCNDENMTVITNPQYGIPLNEGGLYDNETGSDITFVAGIDDDTWRFPGHRVVLAEANEVFYAMLYGPVYNGECIIYIKDVDKRAFQQLLKYLYQQRISLPSVATARATLAAAHKYICPGLIKECAAYLDLHLSPSTVLDIFQDLRFFCSRIPEPGNAPTAPPLHAISIPANDSRNEESMTETCDSLMHNCLLYIDENADAVLQQEHFEELGYSDIAIIANRDTLNLSSELELFNALNRWCKSECKRNKKELTSANRRDVLGSLSYSIRYLLMTEKEFISGPQASELLDLTECKLILAHMRGDSSTKFSPEQLKMLHHFGTPRTKNLTQPIHLSDRSKIILTKVESESLDDKDKGKKGKKKAGKLESKKKLKDDIESDDKKSECSCSCFGEGLLRAFICIFD